MLEENLIKIYETSFRENREMPALTDYFKGETFSYYEMAKEIAKRIENEMEFPGQIRVNVIRETRSVEYAK